MRLREILFNIVEKVSEVWLVASWDIVRQARRPRYFIVRLIFALVLSGQFLWMWASRFGNDVTKDSVILSPAVVISSVRSIYYVSLLYLSIGIILFCPLLTVGSIAGDRERKVWYDIVNSPLSGWTILMGKMAGRLATVFSWLLSILPVWAILGLVGGLDPVMVLCGFVLLIFYGWFYAAIGLFASTVTSRTRDAMALTTAITGVLFYLPLIAEIICEVFLGYRRYSWLWESFIIFNPFYVNGYLQRMFGSNSGFIFGINDRLMFGLIVGMGPLLTLISGLILRRASQRLERSGVRTEKTTHRQIQQRESVDAFVKYDHAQGLAAIWHSPMAIKERKIRSGSRLVRICVKFVAGMFLLSTSWFLIYYGSRAFTEMLAACFGAVYDKQRRHFGELLMLASGVAHFVLVLAISIDTASRLVSEKEADSWLTLISTPIEPREIYSGKAIGAFWAWRWLIGYILICWAFGVIAGSISLSNLILTLFIWLLHLSFAVVLGLRIGSTSTNYQSMLFKIITVWGILQLLVPLVLASTFTEAALVFSPSVSAGIAMNNYELHLDADDQPLLTLFVRLQFGLFCISTLVLGNSSLRNFDRWNDRNVAEPGR